MWVHSVMAHVIHLPQDWMEHGSGEGMLPFYEKAGDQFVGRTVCGLSPLPIEFATPTLQY